MLKQQHQLFTSLLVLFDSLVITAACYAAWAFRVAALGQAFPDFPSEWETSVRRSFLLFAVPIVLGAMWLCGLYRPRRDKSLSTEYGAILRASLAAVPALFVVLYLVRDKIITDTPDSAAQRLVSEDPDPGRVQFLALAVALPLLLSAHRTVFRWALRQLRRRGFNLRHVAVVGIGRLGQVACRTIERNSWTGLTVAYFISAAERSERKQCLGRSVRGGLGELERTLERHPVDAIYLALPSSRASRLPEVLRRLERFAVEVRVIPDVPPRYLPQSMTVGELDGMPVLSYRECPTRGLGGISKRALDVVGALVALALFSPTMLLCALAVRLSSPGPVIFKQRRVSIAGETFKIYKFRTMYDVHDEEAPAWTSRDDPRITPVGRVLRRTSLDELPQLINVLKGQMSLVGPRPERPELIERFREDWRGYMIRQHVKAGITGWAQVNGLRGDTSLRRRLRYDLHYIRHWSLTFDMKILWLTLFRGFAHRNAH
ncbi:MAG TPA: undecaprenyl-phosphate glucose phosphotransferase [Phycisphaerales bacterium]|nr:undecaprenyl-phosphate glucose phosphotransferase [Phycisphaerales bacterium]